MTTLTTAPLGPLLERMFTEAQDPAFSATRVIQSLNPQDVRRLAASTLPEEYRHVYGLAKDSYLAVTPDTAHLLYMLARATRASHIVEFGSSFGVATLHLAAALRDNGGGLLITTEFEPTKAARLRANLAEAELEDLVELREGDAVETLADNLPDQIDLVMLDGAKGLYPAILDLLEGRLRPGALLVADDTDFIPEYLQRVRTPGQYVSVPVAAGLELSMRSS